MGCTESKDPVSALDEAAEEEDTEHDPDTEQRHISIASSMSPEGLRTLRLMLKEKLEEARECEQEEDDDEEARELLPSTITTKKKKKTTTLYSGDGCTDRKAPVRSNPNHRVPFEDICQQLHTGDLVFFHGGGWKSQVIRWFTFSEWSHVGVVLRLPERLLLLESVATEDHIHDYVSEKPRTGVRLINLVDAAFSSHTKYMAVLKIEWPDRSIFEYSQTSLTRFIEEEHGKPYESSWSTLLKLVFNFRPLAPNQLDTREYYCSELVAEAYKSMGLLPSDFNSSDTSPGMFFDINLRLKNGAHVLYIKYVEKPK